ncbi:MAG: glycoside hydrolase family 97 protein [Sedimentisphaerales bacterium]|nr:glycoside hydrolase family 97 protein [Sedimentisphaerales bacterium]
MRCANMKWVVLLVIGAITMAGFGQTAKDYELLSPNKDIKVIISIADKISYSVSYKSQTLLEQSPISLTIKENGALGQNPKVEKVENRIGNEILHPVVREKSADITDHFNEISFEFAGGYGLDFRAYDDGAAYRWRTNFDGTIHVVSEQASFCFSEDHNIYFPMEESFLTHSERLYEYIPISSIRTDKMSCLPALVDFKGGPKIAITESDLEDYPGMYLTGTSGKNLLGKFPAVAARERQVRDRTVEVTERADYIAQTQGRRTFPWRILVIAAQDKELIENQMVYKLAKPCRIEDTSWIRPGKVAWDWWNANNIYGVDFRAGINTDTYKYYIDFASKYGIEYVILDEGWSRPANIFSINPDIDIEELLEHARQKNVGIILWVVWKALDDRLQEALDQFEKWGVKGIKVDFMQRDDQWMVNYYWRVAQEAAKRKLLVDFHGAYKPAGLRRTYPNVLTREGVRGLEHVKWSNYPTPEHNVTLPFTRMLAGPMDYTPGAMNNAQEKNFQFIFDRPMSMGTRCHQLAMYVVFESPLQMLCDSPSHYLREPECMEFLSKVPSVWDRTIALEAKVGDYVLVARKNGAEWYVGAMTDWTKRDMTADFSFLDAGVYTIEIYQDGINADRYGSDYKKIVQKISNGDKLQINLAPGGGWAARIYKD